MKNPTPQGMTNRGHVIRLDPTTRQVQALSQAAGTSRFVYNWALAKWTEQYRSGEKPSAQNLKKQFNAIKGSEFPWVLESPRDANSQPFADLGRAFSNFFASCSGKRKGRKIGYPTFRRRGVDDSFYVANDKFKVRQRGKRGVVRLPVIGDVRMQEQLRWTGKILSGRVYRKADQWFIAIAVETHVSVPGVHQFEIVGVDLGLKTAVVPSHGVPIDAPKPLRAMIKKLKRANRKLHRRMKGGKNRNKARIQVARQYLRMTNVRKEFWNQVTTRLVRENQTIVIEDLSMDFMIKNRRLARAASDVGLGMFRPMLMYKAPVYGTVIIVADRFFPSTQRCNRCGVTKLGPEKVLLGESVFHCRNEKCGAVEDRDLNASLNLEQYPRLAGNWNRKIPTPMDDCASTRRPNRASVVAEVGTKLEHALVLTN